MTLLTFNWHEAYITLLARTGHRFDVVQRHKGGFRLWLYCTRPLPDNVYMTHPDDVRRRLRDRGYDVVICHHFADVAEVTPYDVPVILVFHNYRQLEIELGRLRGLSHPAEDPARFRQCLERVVPIFISEGKRASWQVQGAVIPPGIDLDEFEGYQGSELRALRVGNFLLERDIMMGGRWGNRVLSGIPATTLGINPAIRDARLSLSFDELRDGYRSHRLYLNALREPHEDGYNLALLEAMATGAPVVALRHRGSPVEDGSSGFLAEEPAEARQRILELFDDGDRARRMGGRSREIVRARFPLSRFVSSWEKTLSEVALPRGKRASGRRDAPTHRRLNLLLLYVSYSVTTARHLERALRKHHSVLTVGPTMPDAIYQQWKLENLRERALPHDLPVEPGASLADIWRLIPAGFEPDALLWVETGLGFFPADIAQAPVPTACYLIDTHYHLDWHLRWAREFDLVFIAQKAYLPRFREAGIPSVSWLPLACDPEIHRPGPGPAEWDIGFVGSLVEPRRVALLEELGSHFRTFSARLFLEEMSDALSRARIVWNASARDDLNMRVFETLGAGGFLLTDRAPGSGLSDFFEDGVHLGLYDGDNMVERARYYLERPALREEIARRGRIEALRRHTYEHRAHTLAEAFESVPARPPRSSAAVLATSS
jgi:glycosyltransferase involved in cell wall biosynthesis